MRNMRRSRRRLFTIVMAALVLLSMEGLAFVTGKLLQAKWAMWRPPGEPSHAGENLTYAQYVERRDPLLGWPHPAQYGKELAANGARRNPHFPHGPEQSSCVSLYGDSFTFGGDTSSPAKTWGNVLSARLGCYVANFGTGGYGTDQAYLRFEEQVQDTSPVVVLGIHTENVIRNLTRIRDIVNYERWFALKPRFIWREEGTLERVPMPDLSEEEYLRAVGVRGDLLSLEHESFQPGGPAGVVRLEFPFTWSVLKNMVRFHGFRARILREPEWMAFLQPGHPLHGLEITAGITKKFVELAKRRHKSPMVIVLPHPQDFEYFQKNGRWTYAALIERLRKQDIAVHDFGPYLLAEAQRAGRPVDAYFGPTFHYNDEGNAVVARFVHERLVENQRIQLWEDLATQTAEDQDGSADPLHREPGPAAR